MTYLKKINEGNRNFFKNSQTFKICDYNIKTIFDGVTSFEEIITLEERYNRGGDQWAIIDYIPSFRFYLAPEHILGGIVDTRGWEVVNPNTKEKILVEDKNSLVSFEETKKLLPNFKLIGGKRYEFIHNYIVKDSKFFDNVKLK